MTTLNCAECGTRAEPGQSFCDACGAVLSWTDRAAGPASGEAARAGGSGAVRGAAEEEEEEETAVVPGTAGGPAAAAGGNGTAQGDGNPGGTAGPGGTAPSGSPAPAPVAQGAGAPTTDPGPTPVATAPAAATAADSGARPATAPAPSPAPASAAAQAAAPAQTPTPAPDETAPTEPVPPVALGDTLAERARSLLVPVAEPEARAAAEPAVAPVLPGRPVADRPQVRAPGPVLGDENGVPCPWCSTPNRPDRHFCTRCAMPMSRDDRSPERRPWWRRVLDFRSRETPWAGDRPRLRRTFDRIVSWVVGALVLTLLILAGANAPAAVQATRDHFAKRAPVAPDAVAASRSYPGHKPQLAFDKINNSWWGPGVSESGEGQWIEARFDEPTRLLDLIITPGVSTRPDQLSQSALPHRLKATITTKDGKTTTREITLDQGAGGQRRAFRVGEVTKVRFTIESAYAASAGKQVSIAEIEFFGRSNSNAS
ncbi:zinc ribbon domain-containing protein [Streptomyces sp. NPDC005209]